MRNKIKREVITTNHKYGVRIAKITTGNRYVYIIEKRHKFLWKVYWKKVKKTESLNLPEMQYWLTRNWRFLVK